MKVALINALEKGSKYTDNLGIGCIASFLREHKIDVDIHYVEDRPQVEQYIQTNYHQYNIYGFPMFDTNALFVFKIARIIKQMNPNAVVVAGGHLATSAPAEILEDCSDIDCVILGAGEYPMLEIVRAVENNTALSVVNSVKTREDIEEKKLAHINIEDMRRPARDNLILSFQKNNYVSRISTSRGCCGHCTFCCANEYSSRWEGWDMDDVFQEIRELHEEYGVQCFTFNDGSFEEPGKLGKQRVESLSKQIVEYPDRMSFRCFLRAETFQEKDVPLIRLMRKAGFTQVIIGFEAANEQDLNFYGKIANVDDNRRALRLFTENDIDVIIGYIMLNPLSTKATLRENFVFLKEVQTYILENYTNRLQVYYNTKVYQDLKNRGLLNREFTYLTPLAYHYQDDWAREVNDFLLEYIDSKPIYRMQYDFMEFIHVFRDIYILYHEDISAYVQQLRQIKNQLGKLLSEYFEIIYVDCDLNRAKRENDRFVQAMVHQYQQARKLYLHMIKTEPFRAFFMKNS